MKKRFIVLLVVIAFLGFTYVKSPWYHSPAPVAYDPHATAFEKIHTKEVADPFAELRDREVEDTFTELDRNKDGKVEGAELPSALNVRLLEADKDGDRLLSVEEVEILTGPWTRATYEKFVKLDANSDGVLTDKEIEAAKVQNWQSEDWNGDGAIAIAEFNRLAEGG